MLTDTRTHAIFVFMKPTARIEQHRSLIILDVENMIGNPCPTFCDVDWVKRELGVLIADFGSIQCIVACSHRAAKTVAFLFPSALQRWRSGPDGADDALIEEMTDLRVMARYDRVILCSGDGKFVPYVAALTRLGVHVTVISRPECLSKRLRLVAQSVVEFMPNELVEPAVMLERAS
jgi:hypothetical protein